MMFRSRGFRFGLIASVVAAGSLTAESNIRREGAYWVETETGTERISPQGGLRITTLGGVTVKGGPQDEVSYSLTKRVKARSEAEARRLLNAFRVRTSKQGDFTFLVVQNGFGMADLQVAAPRSANEIVVGTRGGGVEASDLDGIFKAETGGGLVSLDRIGGNVEAKTAGGDIVLGQIGGAVRCISGGGPIRAANIHGAAWFETAGGDIVVQQVDGAVRCSTAGGGIRIAEAGGAVVADTAGGPIDVGRAQGMVTAKNSGGPIQVGAARGARCESAGGAIRLNNISGSLRASTAVGSVVARLLDQPVTDSFLSTGAGDITVWIPSNLRVTIRAQNETYGGVRRIVSEFPGIVVKSMGAAAVAEGDLNGGGPLLRLAGNGGTIYIRRQAK